MDLNEGEVGRQMREEGGAEPSLSPKKEKRPVNVCTVLYLTNLLVDTVKD